MERATASAEAPAQAEPDAVVAAPAEARSATRPSRAASSAHVLALQRSAGNRATVRALARAPLDTVPAADRTRLREVTDTLPTINVTALHSPPGTTGGTVRGSVSPAPVYGAAIATSAVLLDLTPYGGTQRVYRFTRVVSGEPPQESYFIDDVGTEAAAPAPRTDATAAFPTGRFDTHRFTAPAGDRDFEAIIRAAVQMIPDRLLTPIDGASFRRAGTDPHDASVGGRYDHQAHTVTIYDPGMRQTSARFGDAGGAVGPRLRTILHELGHAIDEAPLRTAWTARETA